MTTCTSTWLLKANPHHWGPGKVHVLVGGVITGKTRCGRTQDKCPGSIFLGSIDDLTCLGCEQGIEKDEHQAWLKTPEGKATVEEHLRAQARARDEADAQWWSEYDEYLTSVEWQEKREQVMLRADWWCEYCHKEPAVMVHHLSYAHVGNERLDELLAVCRDCHELFHPGKTF